MMEAKPIDKFTFLYTNIGRGHPFYLDGILEAMVRRGHTGLIRGQRDVFELATGPSLLAWKTALKMYRAGSSGGMLGRVYGKIRSNSNYNRPNPMLKIMGQPLREEFMADESRLVVAHPTLVAMLKGRSNLIYQHGELVAPSESLVKGASYVMVPTQQVAQSFHECGYASGQVKVTGLCVEPPLVRLAEDAFNARLHRLEQADSLTGAFYSSGAEQKPHVGRLVAACLSVALHGGKSIVFARAGGRLALQVERAVSASGVAHLVVDSRDFIPAEIPPVLIVKFASRREENTFTARLFSAFDFVVAPSHERTNWSMGLGLPMFVVSPSIGPYAPLNRRLMLQSGVAQVIDSMSEALEFHRLILNLRRSGTLARMSRSGYGTFDISGFDRIAGFFANYSSLNTL